MNRIVDVDGNPIETAQLSEPQTANTAWLEREFDSHPARALTPQRLHQILIDAEQRDLVGQLDLADDIEERDGHCFAELSKRKLAVSALEWDVVEPERASAAEKSVTAQVREWLKSLPDFEDVINEMQDGLLKGFCAHELVWNLHDRVLLPALTFRPQRWFCIGARRNDLLLRSQTNQAPAVDGLPTVMGEPLRRFTWMLHRPRSRTGYISRAGLVRVLAWPYIFKSYATKDLAEFLEIFGIPMRVGSYPSGASEREKRTLLRAVTEIGHNAAGIIPQGMKIDFQAAAVGTQVPFMSMIQLMDAVQSKVILGQTLTAGEGTHGTQALGNVHNEVRMDIRKADLRQVASTITSQLIQPLVMLNIAGAGLLRLPSFVFDDAEGEDVQVFSEALPKLAKAGMKISVDWAHDKLRIPQAEDGQEVLGAAGKPQPAGDDLAKDATNDPSAGPDADPAKERAKRKAALAALPGDASRSLDSDPLDDIAADMLGGWTETLGPMVEPLLVAMDNAVAQGETLDAFRARMPALLDSMNYKPMAMTLAQGTFIARLAGETDLQLHDESQVPSTQGDDDSATANDLE
jgi:phage gp29-like protein